jgi:glutamyl-tRNA synthetase
MKAYKANPENYPGNVSDVAEMLRIATTGLSNTPDLWTIMQILGETRTLTRLEKAILALG